MIMKLKPYAKSAIWGGTRLKEGYGIVSQLENVAEAWCLSCLKDCESIVENGEYAGLTLPEAIKRGGNGILGTRAQKYDDFPILIKLIDAMDDLSVQVHPGDEYAKEHFNSFGKTEVWYIVDCDEGAHIIYGFKNKITTAEFEEAIRDNEIDSVVEKIEVKRGDFFLIESGTLHAICKGILLAEVQQNSDITFRAYDYNRLDKKTGQPRQLHIKETLDVTKCEPASPSVPICTAVHELYGATVFDLIDFELFSVKRIEANVKYSGFTDENSFAFVMILEGEGEIICGGEKLAAKKGDGFFLSAASGEYVLNGKITALESKI